MVDNVYLLDTATKGCHHTSIAIHIDGPPLWQHALELHCTAPLALIQSIRRDDVLDCTDK